MALRVTVDIFSGRRNPVFTVDGAEAKELVALAQAEASIKRPEKHPVLGYRGLILESDTPIPGKKINKSSVSGISEANSIHLAPSAGGSSLEERIFEKLIARKDLGLTSEHISELRNAPALSAKRTAAKAATPGKLVPCPCGPVYEPAWWNVHARQSTNNCYNYATNIRSDTYAQPGDAAGQMIKALTCEALRTAVLLDKLLPRTLPLGTCPPNGHLVAAVIWPGVDYHWYRRDRSGYWSHKPGTWPITDLDTSGRRITDPRNAERWGYTVFCNFFLVKHGHIKIF